MRNRHYILMAVSVLLCAVLAAPALATVHEVRLEGMEFIPNDITIEAADTIRFLNENLSGGDGYGGPGEGETHSVTADDFSWDTGISQGPWEFERSFDEPGVFLIHCRVHGAPGGNINISMNARITVTGVEPAFQINPGLNGSWANFDTLGQGFFIDVFPDIPLIFFAWFTWETGQAAPAQNESLAPQAAKSGSKLQAVVGDDNHRWLTAQGPFSGNSAVLNVTLTTGGLFDDPTPVTNSTAGEQGTITLTFDDCKTGTVDYDFTAIGLSGSVPIQRLSEDNVLLCESMDGIDDPQ